MRYCGILALQCAVLRYSYPPYAPLKKWLQQNSHYAVKLTHWCLHTDLILLVQNKELSFSHG